MWSPQFEPRPPHSPSSCACVCLCLIEHALATRPIAKKNHLISVLLLCVYCLQIKTISKLHDFKDIVRLNSHHAHGSCNIVPYCTSEKIQILNYPTNLNTGPAKNVTNCIHESIVSLSKFGVTTTITISEK